MRQVDSAMESWLKENAIECMRFGAVLSPDACKRFQKANRGACDGCKWAGVE